MHLVTISGLPGSGTSTLSRKLAEATGWRYLNAGQVFRDLARESGASLEDFSLRAEADGDIDRRLDQRMVELARQAPGCILEGRLTGWMAVRHRLEALKIWIDADLATRAERVAHRDGQDLEAATASILAREASERQRYTRYHGIDLVDRSIYDLILDSDAASVEVLHRRIEAAMCERGMLA